MNFEKAIARIENIVQQLETVEIGLEEAVVLYEEGMKIAHSCQKKLSKAERKVFILKENINSNNQQDNLEGKKEKSDELMKQNFDLFENE